MSDPFKPSASILIKLGSIAVHVEEFLSPTGHPFDKNALDTLFQDKELKKWLKQMDKLAMLPNY